MTEALGWAAASGILVGYALVVSGRLSAGYATSLVASVAFVAFNLMRDVVPGVALNIVFGALSAGGLAKEVRRARSRPRRSDRSAGRKSQKKGG